MAITLEVKEYCQECPYFEATSSKIYTDNEILRTYVICEHRQFCDNIHNYLLDIMLQKRLEEKENGKEEN